MKKLYSFAGIEICLDIPDSLMYTEERGLAEFSVDRVNNPFLYQFDIVDELMPPEGDLISNTGAYRIYRNDSHLSKFVGFVGESSAKAYGRVDYDGKSHRVQILRSAISERIPVHVVLNILGIEHLAAKSGGFVFHCSYISFDDGAILFTAPSGVGKSTQAELWAKHRGAEIINGDRAAVHVRNGIVYAEGIPFSGSSEFCKNRILPVKAIVYLTQAQRTSIHPLSGFEAFAKIWQGISADTWNREDMEVVSKAAQETASLIPIYHLACTPDVSAVVAVEQAIERR